MSNRSNKITNEYDQAYEQNYYAWNSFYSFAEKDLRFYLGDQWDEAEKRELFQQGRSTFVYNMIRPNINMVSGYQKKHRHSSIVVPSEFYDQNASDQLSKLLLYSMQYGNAYETISECFRGALITGWNLFCIFKDYREDPLDGDICFIREPYNAWICDPYFSKKDFSDCSNICRRKYISLDQTKSILPGHEKQLDELFNIGWERDDKFTWLPYQQQPNGQKMIAFDEYWTQGWEKKKYIYNASTGESIEYFGEDSDYFLYADPNAEIITKNERFVEQHIIVNSQYIKTVKNPYGLNEYPFVPFFCIFEPESSDYILKVQSLIRVMIDPQREANRRRSQMIDIVESQINSGWIAEEDACVNPRSLYKTGQGQVIWKRRGLQQNALERMQPSQVPPSFFQLNELHDKDIMKVANISEELLGQADSEQDSGLKVMLRQGAALVGLQDVFDNLRYAQKILSKKILKIIQSWSKQKIERILGEKADEKILKKSTIKFDISVQEGVLTDTQQQMFFRQLITLKELGEPIPPGLLAQAAPLQGKSQYNKALEQYNKQQQQAQQQAQTLQQQLINSESQLAQSQSLSNIASAKERFSRAMANMGLEEERVSKSLENRASTNLERLKTIKELESIDDSRLEKLINIVLRLEEFSKQNEAEKQLNDISIANKGEVDNEGVSENV